MNFQKVCIPNYVLLLKTNALLRGGNIHSPLSKLVSKIISDIWCVGIGPTPAPTAHTR